MGTSGLLSLITTYDIFGRYFCQICFYKIFFKHDRFQSCDWTQEYLECKIMASYVKGIYNYVRPEQKDEVTGKVPTSPATSVTNSAAVSLITMENNTFMWPTSR